MEIGKRLKEAREEKGLTLEAVEEETKIRRKYLRALEEEQFQVLPGPVYAKAFLKTYTRFLGIDAGDVFANYSDFFTEAPAEAPEHIFEEEKKARVPRKPRSRLYLTVAAVIVCVAVLGLYFNSAKGKGGTPVDNPSAYNPENPAISGQTEPPVQPPPVEPQQPADSSVVKLDLNVKNSDCWMSVTVDGKQAFVGTLIPGQSKHFEGTDKIKITLGNAGAVEASLNGQNLGLMGKSGDVVNREFKVQPSG
ncbi:DUF4115 domain-containing protein [Pelotomaculum terephthalicicum JT]|uniref:helix-turn-helix domain-containing protein n=1 Tax=Pelotomaculum TaxID=191373 RepID=UPI0009D09462|nr:MULTISPECIES: helix-turn-helix domain-containing protein [Pelotomaculum]MCG9969725.1 DUF4115 domain-containing protein [Pelotomaculum terephthalicicum JT]OPX91313.1 MAG: cytoskeletal protein RodZ [Pelotomaculum sp. PtaB.Bin117]OPY60647.1 MAG: cytoskeletal protein RodZ [Pelotomaculum sp. PtaU1.Bin065]